MIDIKTVDFKKIKIIATDIDGVLTDGHCIVNSSGEEYKRISFRDLDAIGYGRKLGIDFALVTGEDNKFVDFFSNRFSIQIVYKGAKDKLAALRNICDRNKLGIDEICYIGDSLRDAEAIGRSGFGVAPADAAKSAREAADFVTESRGGDGVLAELIELFIKKDQ
ncbi:MAG: HAD hydrolase family protein [Oligoflexales bacterium]|nr:HAD hydrolase family protein [Oligoflexales bacterium]